MTVAEEMTTPAYVEGAAREERAWVGLRDPLPPVLKAWGSPVRVEGGPTTGTALADAGGEPETSNADCAPPVRSKSAH